MTYRQLSAISQIVQHRDAPGSGLLLTAGMPDRTMLLANSSDGIQAIFLSGERRFSYFPLRTATSTVTSIYFANPIIDVDFGSVYDAATSSDPPGALIVGSGDVHIALNVDHFGSQAEFLPLWAAPPLCVGMANAGFTKWRLRLSADDSDTSLIEVDVSASQT